jgi:two-component system, response regulator PdtaR
MHALIIEDQFLVAAFIEDVLRGIGYTSFDIVDREDDAIRAAEERCPDLITADHRITSGSGVQAVRVICARRAIPVVFISAFRSEVRKLVPGAVLIGKPFVELTLRDAVEQAILLSLRSAQAAE